VSNTLSIGEIEQYVNEVIPNIQKELGEVTDDRKMVELYNLYEDVLCLVAKYDFRVFNMYLELDDDMSNPQKGFYYHRKESLGELFDALNDMELYDKYDMVLISTAPRLGKSTTGIRFLAWIIGKYPENTQLATSYSDAITQSFYNGVMEIVEGERFQKVFPESPLVNQNAKREEIWLRVQKRYPSIVFASVGASVTGRAEAGNYLYCDDLVSGIEEALSRPRLDKLWELYTTNLRQRKKKGAKEIHIATMWSVHDPISKLVREHKNNPRVKVIRMPVYDEHGESKFDFPGGFDTAYYKDIEKSMDKLNFGALYLCNPIEREGLLYHEDEMQYYFQLPDEKPDTIIAVCDSKNLGKDNVSSPAGYVYGDYVYIEDVVYNDGLPEITRPLVANMWLNHNVVRADVEMNNGGNYYAEDLAELIKHENGKTSIRTFFSGNNKDVKIITYSDYVKKYFIFRHPSTYSPNSPYASFMEDVFAWTQTGKNPHDDAPDTLAMLAQLHQELTGNTIKFLSRKELRI
jgi:predicted phage terminase large subunit-like protein